MVYLIVFLGGGLGAAMRHGVNVAAARTLGTGFPYGTLTVNVVGSLAMGLFAAYFAFKGDASQHWRLFFTTGVLGGFTTFSAFSLDAVLLYERGQSGSPLYMWSPRSRFRSPRCLPGWRWCAISAERRPAKFLRYSIARRPSLSNSFMSLSRPGLGVVRSFGP